MYLYLSKWYNHKRKVCSFLGCLVWRLNNTTKRTYFFIFYRNFIAEKFTKSHRASDFVLLAVANEHKTRGRFPRLIGVNGAVITGMVVANHRRPSFGYFAIFALAFSLTYVYVKIPYIGLYYN